MKVLLCRIGWMERYDGKETLHRGRMKWDGQSSGEDWNFVPGGDGLVRGFGMLTSKNSKGEYSGTINIDRLGAHHKDESIDGVLVIFYAAKNGSGKNYVVGWYENARVHRTWEPKRRDLRNDYRDNQPYSFEVKAEGCFLIPTEQRNIPVTSAVSEEAKKQPASFPGQACVFFGSSNQEYVASIVRQLAKEKGSKVAKELAVIGRGFYARGWVLGTSGNFSAVVSRDPLRLAITSSGIDKGVLGPENILLIDDAATVLEGNGRPSAETLLHLAIARLRGAGAVLHTHSVWSNILSNAFASDGGLKIEGYEMLKGLEGVSTHEHSEWLPVIENSQDMTGLAASVSEALNKHPESHGFLLLRHGLYTWGRDLEEAKRHVEIFEFLLEVTGRTYLASR